MGVTPMSGATPKATPPRRTTLSAGSQRSPISTPSPKATMTLRPPDLPPLPAGHGPRGSMQVRFAGSETGGEEGGTHTGKTLLQVHEPNLRHVPVGSGGDQAADHEDEGSGRGSKEEEVREDAARGDSSEAGGERGRDADQGRMLRRGRQQDVSRCTRNGTEDDEPSRSEASRDNADHLRRTQDAAGIPPEPTDVDDHSGWRGEGATGDGRSCATCSDGAAGVGAQEEHGGHDEKPFSGRLRGDEEIEGIQGDAPWVTKIGPGKVWNNAIKMQLEEADLPEEQRRIHPRYWTRDEEGAWKSHHGILPVEAPEDGAMVALWSGDHRDEDYLDEVDRTLQKGCRKRIARKMRDVTVSEVYSRPRISEKAEEMGLRKGTAFDLWTGYDFRKKEDRQRCWRKLKEEQPELLVVCPPCGPFSNLQNLNYPKMDVKKAVCMVAEGLEHLQFSMQLFEWQVRRGGWALFEHPMTSAAWNEECVLRVMKLDHVRVVRGDQCMFDLRVREGEERSKKATKFMSNSEKILRRLDIRCDGQHTHQELMGGRAKKAEEYPPELCEAVVQGLKDENLTDKIYVGVFPAEDAEDQEKELDLEDAL